MVVVVVVVECMLTNEARAMLETRLQRDLRITLNI